LAANSLKNLVVVLAILKKEAQVMHPFTATLKKFLIGSLTGDVFDEFDLDVSRICDGDLELMVGGFAAKRLFGCAFAEIVYLVKTSDAHPPLKTSHQLRGFSQ
jgi:hypothetical protein